MTREAAGKGKQDGSQAIARAMALLKAIASGHRDGSAAYVLADRVGLQRPTVHRILRRLVLEEMVEQDPGTRHYRLGRLAYELGLSARRPAHMRQTGSAALGRIARESEDVAFLYSRSGPDCVCIDRAEGAYPVRALVMEVGQRRPMGTGAASLSMLSALPDHDVATILHENAPRLKAAEEQPIEELLSIVQQARADGYVFKNTVRIPEALSLAVPILNRHGLPIMALSISSIASRMVPRMEYLASLLRREAGAVRSELEKTNDANR